MIRVAFDTSTDACSVAVQVKDEIVSDHRIVQREHAALLLPMLSELLGQIGVSPRQIEGVVFGQGPGSFTGLRIAAAAAQGLALAADCGVYGVSTLQAMAGGYVRQNKDGAPVDAVMCAIDARMDQIYANTYRYEPLVASLSEEAVVHPDDYQLPEQWIQSNAEQSNVEVVLCGSGAVRYESELRALFTVQSNVLVREVIDVYPHAIDLLRLSENVDSSHWKPAADAQPVYLRNKVALTEAERSST